VRGYASGAREQGGKVSENELLGIGGAQDDTAV